MIDYKTYLRMCSAQIKVLVFQINIYGDLHTCQKVITVKQVSIDYMYIEVISKDCRPIYSVCTAGLRFIFNEVKNIRTTAQG